jgi:hypothetical protein
MFEYQLKLIRELGLEGWLREYPINPVTIIAGVVVLGIIVLIVNAKVRKRRALDNKPSADAAVVILQMRNSLQNLTWADNVRVEAVNGGPAHWFFHKAVAAIWLRAGENTLTLHAEWARRKSAYGFKTFKTPSVRLVIDVSAEEVYALHYHIERERYILTEGDRFEDDAFDRDVAAHGVWLG